MTDHEALQQRLRQVEDALRQQQRLGRVLTFACAGLLIVMLTIPGALMGLVSLLTVVAIVGGVLLFIPAIVALLEWISPSGRVPPHDARGADF